MLSPSPLSSPTPGGARERKPLSSPSPGDPLLSLMQRVMGEGTGEGDGGSSPHSRIQGIPERVSNQIESQHRQHDGRPGEEERPPGAAGEELVAIRPHGAPLRRRRLRADA